jgi:hypothetical protein
LRERMRRLLPGMSKLLWHPEWLLEFLRRKVLRLCLPIGWIRVQLLLLRVIRC